MLFPSTVTSILSDIVILVIFGWTEMRLMLLIRRYILKYLYIRNLIISWLRILTACVNK